MSEGQQQPLRTINIETLPRITPKSTSKITSLDYPHDSTDVDDGNCWPRLVRRRGIYYTSHYQYRKIYLRIFTAIKVL